MFVFLMNKFFYAPLTDIISERENLVDDTLHEAKNSRDTASGLLAERESKLNKAYDDSKKLISESVENANLQAKERTQQAKNNSVNEINRQKANLSDENDWIKSNLDNTVKDLAEVITSKILG